MREAGVKIAVPLVSQGELVGLLNLGPRLSQQEYSADDRALLNNLAAQAAPAVRVAQMVRQQQAEAQERERIEQELRVARLIQQTLLPRAVPELPGWQLGAYYRPAREVGGDFYDFLALPGGNLGLVVGDVTDKGVPAALVMATTRSILRGAAQRSDSPGRVLELVNESLCPDILPNMFVTCLYAVLDPESGSLRYANAGHPVPYLRCGGSIAELRATGMPLGLMPGTNYEENEAVLEPTIRGGRCSASRGSDNC
jgi:serine phosphatase RsbU (regulator of sigma subunit)